MGEQLFGIGREPEEIARLAHPADFRTRGREFLAALAVGQLGHALLDLDDYFGSDAGWVKYDYKAPGDIPPALRGAFDAVVIDPPFITEEVWTLYAEAGNSGGSAPFAVLQYRKPEFRVTVAPEREVAVNGDDVRFRVAADYLFGAPVVGATVRWTLFESRLERAVEWSAWDP